MENPKVGRASDRDEKLVVSANMQLERAKRKREAQEEAKVNQEKKEAEIDALCRLDPCNDDQCERGERQ